MTISWLTRVIVMFSFSASIAQSSLENDINTAFLTSIQDDTDRLATLVNDMEVSSDNIRYWKAYALYKETIVHFVYERENEAETTLNHAIELLRNIENKNSDEYALLSIATGFSIQFSPIMAPVYGKQAENYAKDALEKDENNIRAHYALANTDYYKPTMFGGGNYVEKHLLKAVNLPEQSAKSGRAATWGKPEIFKLLIRYYNRENRPAEAKLYLNKARRQFPDDKQLISMKVK